MLAPATRAWVSLPAELAVAVSLVFALATFGLAILLLARRQRDEQRREGDDRRIVETSRQLLTLVRQGLSPDEPLPDVGGVDAQHIVAHLLLLVRGEDRERLLALAIRMNLPEQDVAALSNRSPARRVDAIRRLEAVPVASAVAALRKTMADDPSYDVRLEAAGALARLDRLPGPAMLAAELDIAQRPLNRLHVAIFRAAAARHLEQMISISRDPTLAHIRPLIVEALGWSDGFAALPALGLHSADENPDVRSAALRAVQRLAHPSAADWVLPRLLDPVDHVRVQAALACGKLGLRDAIPILSGLVESHSWWVRRRATEALQLLRPAQPAPTAALRA